MSPRCDRNTAEKSVERSGDEMTLGVELAVDSGSFVAAAKRLNVSQAAISMRIRIQQILAQENMPPD